MTLALLGPLVLLALIDATSFGTLLIPVWFLLTPGRIRATRVLVFLGTIAAFYWVLGLLLSAGAVTFLDDLSGWLDTETGQLARKVVGIGLIAIGILLPGNRKARSERANDGAATRVSRWRARAMGVDAAGGGAGALVGLALAAATVEAASLLPYLAAIGMLSTSPLPMTGRAVVLVGYCLLMIAPALVLLALRLGLGSRVEPTLRRLAAWMERQSGETVAWILAIMGVLILRGAVWG